MKKAILSALLVIPTLVACGEQKIVSTQDSNSNPVLINCTSEKISWPNAQYEELTKFRTPKGASEKFLSVLKEEGNPYAMFGSALILKDAKSLIKKTCDTNVEITEPDEDNISTIKPQEPTAISFGEKASYRDGITITLKDVSSYSWVKSTNMFTERVSAPQGQVMLIIDVAIGNDGTSPSTLSGRELQLMDSQGRRFDPETYNTDFTMWVNENRDNDLSDYDSVNPGSSNNKVLLFFVPKDSKRVTMVERNEFIFSLEK